jgi:ankyrin repeat protein
LLAVLNGHIHTATVLLESDADASLSDKDGHTPMSCACQYGHLATAKLLSSYGASRHFDLSF